MYLVSHGFFPHFLLFQRLIVIGMGCNDLTLLGALIEYKYFHIIKIFLFIFVTSFINKCTKIRTRALLLLLAHLRLHVPVRDCNTGYATTYDTPCRM